MVTEAPTEKESRIYYLYRITNKINKKIYIGQSVDPRSRWTAHKRDAKKAVSVISKAIHKHGVDNFEFEVIASCIGWQNANDTETLLVTQYNCQVPNGYNVAPGGINAPKTEAWKQMMRNHWADPAWRANQIDSLTVAQANRTPEEKVATSELLSSILQGRHLSPGTEFKTGHKLSNDSLQKLSDSHKGLPIWNKGTKGVMKPNKTSFKDGQTSWLKGTKGKSKNQHQLPDETVRYIFESVKNKTKTRQQIMEEFNLSDRAVRNLVSGRTYSNITSHI